jgi:hypothetical protein
MPTASRIPKRSPIFFFFFFCKILFYYQLTFIALLHLTKQNKTKYTNNYFPWMQTIREKKKIWQCRSRQMMSKTKTNKCKIETVDYYKKKGKQR